MDGPFGLWRFPVMSGFVNGTSLGIDDEKKKAIKSVRKRGVHGGALLDVEDMIDETLLHDPRTQINPDGTITLYHRTTSENAKTIVETGQMTGFEDALFFGTEPTGEIDGYGETAIKVKLPLEKLQMDDIFTNEVHFRYSLKMPGEKIRVKAVMA